MELNAALTRILRPLVRLMITRGVTFPDLSEMLKPIFVRCAEADFGLDGKRMTDSRISLLTGLQRRDVRAHRGEEKSAPSNEQSAGPLPRIISRWLSDPEWRDGGSPRTLSRAGKRGSFEALVHSVSRDMHPRTLLDELERQGAVSIDGDEITLLADSYLPNDDGTKLAYLSANLGDHLDAATANLTAAEPPFFERAVHYNGLSEKSLETLERMARDKQHALMKALSAEADRLQKKDNGNTQAQGRFRLGAFIYVEKSEDPSP